MVYRNYDIVIYGATPCGISSALTAARNGKSTLLIAKNDFVGGLMASGLSCTDVRFVHAHGGIFKEFVNRVLQYYETTYGAESQQVKDCNQGIWFEPHVAEKIFEDMLAKETSLTVLRENILTAVELSANEIVSLTVRPRADATEIQVKALAYIDATYEGDLAALAKVDFIVGRESREKFAEPYAGHIFLKNPGLQVLPESTGKGDSRTQAYNFRLTLTNVPENRIPFKIFDGYNRETYKPIAEAANKGLIKGIEDVIRLSPIPNGKFNGNNRPTILSLDLPEVNTDYPDGDEQTRALIIEKYKTYTLGLLYFMQNDEELPGSFLEESKKWGFCKDEFQSTGGLSRELYIREARRIIGLKTFTSHDVFLSPGSERSPIHEDSIAIADYQVDSHIVQRQQGNWPQYEGHVYLRPISKPAQVPFGIMVPQKIKGLLVPGAVSSTHLGFSVLRMEPVWMALGQAAAEAAVLLCNKQAADTHNIPIEQVQKNLLESGQFLTFFFDVGVEDNLWELLNVPFEKAKLDHISTKPLTSVSKGILFFGCKGFFDSYYSRPLDPLTRYEAALWLFKLSKIQKHKAGNGHAKIKLSDIPVDHVLSEPVNCMINSGVMQPWLNTDDGFYGAAAVSKSSALEIVVNYHKAFCKWPDDKKTPFNTLKENNLLSDGWLTGPENLGFYVTREEFLDLLYNCYFNNL